MHDRMLRQQAGELVDGRTLGSAGADWPEGARTLLLGYGRLLLLLDADEAGEGAAARLSETFAIAQHVPLPDSQDVTDFDLAGGDLRAVSGKRHSLARAVCVVRDGLRLWHHRESARLTMRPLGDAFIEAYLDAIGETALTSIGAYQLEGLGAQLFSRVEGDYFTILGLPLLPLLAYLRDIGQVQS